MNLNELTETCHHRIEKVLRIYFQERMLAMDLQKAMAYSVTNGGKRIRPLLVYATGISLGGNLEDLDVAACAVELIHAYSLIHDDLPAMDNADIRRGKPSCHKAFNEALAILAGDALQPLAFEIIATHPALLTSEQRVALVQTLSRASGVAGMAGGQSLDLAGSASLVDMYKLKTGALLVASVEMGAIAANLKNPEILQYLKTYAENIGLAFQMQDDLLDFEASEVTGKPKGLDLMNKKLTLSAQLGVGKTREAVEKLFASALDSLLVLKEKGALLRELGENLMRRKM